VWPRHSVALTGSRDAQNPAPFGVAQNPGHLRAILGGYDTTTYELDRGQRNDEPFADGTLAAKERSNDDCVELIMKRYRCTKHGPGAMCWVPGTGACVGEHVRLEGSIPSKLLISHMVRSFITDGTWYNADQFISTPIVNSTL
jgi:hypothetical protein